MGIYHDVNPVYGKNENGKRVHLGLKINGVFYKGIKKTGEIPVSKPKQKTESKVKSILKKRP